MDSNRRTRQSGFTFAVIVIVSCISVAHGASTDEEKAAAVKAGLVYHLIKLTKWSPSKFSSESTPVSVCVIGRDRHGFANSFERQSRNHMVHGRSFLIKRFLYENASAEKSSMSGSQKELISMCHVLFVHASEISNYAAIIAAVESAGVLTVGDTERFLHAGGMISFTMDEDGRIKIATTFSAVESNRLEISSEFLRHARFVDRGASNLDISSETLALTAVDQQGPHTST